MISSADLEDVAELLRVLGHNVRLALLRSLVAGERSVGDVEAQTGIGQPTLSQQLGILRKADLVLTRREAKLVYYRIHHDRLSGVSALLDSFAGTISASVQPQQSQSESFGTSGTAASFARVAPLMQRDAR